MAENQAVVGLVAAGLEHVSDTKIQQVTALTFAGVTIQMEQRNKAMNYFISMMVEKMRKAGIYTVLVKGQGVGQCYERPLWRSCGDVNLFFDAENYERAKTYLIPLATSVESEEKRKKYQAMVIDTWLVELHGLMPTEISECINAGVERVQNNIFADGGVRIWKNDEMDVLLPSPDNDVIIVFAHFLQHFFVGGVGLRQICDWCRLLWTYRSELDVAKLEGRLRLAGLMTAWRAFGAFAVEYLGMDAAAMPFYSDAAKWKRKASRIRDFVLMSGNFGHNRDHSYFEKYPYLMRKCVSFGRRVGDLARHARIFPIDSLRFSPAMLVNGVRSAVRGE